jgi:pyruvate dehydrogenase E2 component (dihydrolipoamide acetyltransferase)
VGGAVARLLRVNGESLSEDAVSPVVPAEAVEVERVAEPPKVAHGSEVRIPPRTVSYCRQRGIAEEQMLRIPAQGSTLSIADVDLFLSTGALNGGEPSQGYRDIPLSAAQAGLKFRLERSAMVTVPAAIRSTISWEAVEEARRRLHAANEQLAFSHFQVLAYCVAQATVEHPKFRSALLEKNAVRQYDHVNLGFAVALPNDDLITAVVRDADLLDPAELARAMMRQLRLARRGADQAGKDTQITLSYMPDMGITDGMPVFVAPAVATMFLGAHHRQGGREVAHLVLSFDHRLINGLGAAKFLQTVERNLDKLAGEQDQK